VQEPLSNTIVLSPPVPPSQNIRGSSSIFKRYSLYGMAIGVFLIGIYASFDSWLTNRAVTTTASVLSERTIDESSHGLSEAEPADKSQYSVRPELPRIITIPSLGVEARILHLGLGEDNTLLAPSNIYDTSWYTSSAKQVSTLGAMLISGHASGPTKQGVFHDLGSIREGAEIVIERGDGLKTTFVVKATKAVPDKDFDMRAMLRSIEPDKLGLNLMTSSGASGSNGEAHESRVLVFAVEK